MYNEATIRNERIILNIHLEQVRRWREKHVSAFRENLEWIQHHKLLFDCIGFGFLSSCSSPSTSLITRMHPIFTSLHLDL